MAAAATPPPTAGRSSPRPCGAIGGESRRWRGQATAAAMAAGAAVPAACHGTAVPARGTPAWLCTLAVFCDRVAGTDRPLRGTLRGRLGRDTESRSVLFWTSYTSECSVPFRGAAKYTYTTIIVRNRHGAHPQRAAAHGGLARQWRYSGLAAREAAGSAAGPPEAPQEAHARVSTPTRRPWWSPMCTHTWPCCVHNVAWLWSLPHGLGGTNRRPGAAADPPATPSLALKENMNSHTHVANATVSAASLLALPTSSLLLFYTPSSLLLFYTIEPTDDAPSLDYHTVMRIAQLPQNMDSDGMETLQTE